MINLEKINRYDEIANIFENMITNNQGLYTYLNEKMCITTSTSYKVLINKHTTKLDYINIPMLATYNHDTHCIDYINVKNLDNVDMIDIYRDMNKKYHINKSIEELKEEYKNA